MIDYRAMRKPRYCRDCGALLPTEAGNHKLYCAACGHERRLASYRKGRKKSYHKHREKYLIDRREEYRYYRERGICVDCHQRDAVTRDGKRLARCAECQARSNAAARETKRKRKKA